MALDTVVEGTLVQPDGPRDPDLPSMYRVTNHPLMEQIHNQDSTAIVYLADLTNEGCLKSVIVSGRQRIPGPGRQNMLNSGAIVTYPGETIFVRDINGSGDPLLDREHSYVVGRSKQSPATMASMGSLADRIIGDESDCTAAAPYPPTDDDGIGGTAFERSFRAKPLRGTTRAYNLGPSYEIQSNSSAPHASGKMFHNEWDDHLDLQKDIIKTHIAAAMKGLEYGPPGLLENLRRHAGLVPMPRIGTDDNVAFTSVQLNIAPVGTIGSDPLTSLGAFGSEHIDVNDSENTFSAAGAYSTLDDDMYDPGYFFYLDIMVCVRMDHGVLAYFSGLRPHGSSGAIRLVGTPPPNAYRIVLVAYAVREILEAYTIMPIAALPGKDDHMHDRVLNLYPEMTPNVYTYEGRRYSTHANYITDGETMMSRRSHLQFIVYSLCFILCYVLNQFPASYRVMFDTQKFCELITILDEDGNRIQAADWPQRPTMNAFQMRSSSVPPNSSDDSTSTLPRSSAYAFTSNVIEPVKDKDAAVNRESDMDALSCETRESFSDNFLFETLPDRSVRPEHLRRLAHINPIREHDAIIWENHAERYAYMIPIARLSRSRETAAGVVYVPGVPGGRPPTKGSKYRALINRAKQGKTLTLDGKDGRDDITMSADPNRVSAKRTRRDNGDTSITSTGKVSTRKRKRKGPDNASIVLDDYDSDFSEGTPEDDDIDYIPKGYSISKTVKQNPRSSRAKVLAGIAKEKSVLSSTSSNLPMIPQHSELSLQVSSELQTTITASDSSVNTRMNPVVDATRPPALTQEILFADIESSDDDTPMSAADLHAVPPVLARLSLPVINAVSCTVTKSAQAMRQRYTTGALPRRPPIDQILQPILLKPYSVLAGLSVATLWENMPSLRDGILLSSFDVAIQRQDLMLLNHAAWKWLRRVCSDYCWSFLLNGGDADNWIKQLTSEVDGVLNTAQNSITISSSSYLPRDEAIEYYWSITASSKSLRGVARHTYILRIVTEIVRLWLGFPMHGVEQAQSRLVELAVNNFSSDVLLLETFWISYNHFKTHVIGDRKITKVLEHHFDALLAHIASHPLADPRSPERSALSNIGRIVNAYRFGVLFTDEFDLTFTGLPPTVTAATTGDNGNGHVFPNAKPSVMLKFLLHSLHLLDPSLPSNSLTDNISSDLNYFLPFREHAPDRIRSRGCHGPFDPALISTSAAFFCALWWRGISFGTGFSRKETMYFDLEEVTEYYEWSQCRFGESAASIYFCDPSIFGSYNPGRTIESGRQFWEASQTHSSWLSQSDSPTYLVQYNFFRSSYVQHQDQRFERLAFTKNSRGNKIKVFPQIGDLVAHLLTADYVYGGKVKMPSVEEMGEVIHGINKGAVGGLRLLGYFGADRPSRALVIAAFRHLYNYLLEKLIARSVSLMTFDVIMLEHALCKLTRARNNGWI